MAANEEFIKKAESRLTTVVGAALAQSIIKGSLAKNKPGLFDAPTFIESIVASAAVVATNAESKQLRSDLEQLLKTCI